MSNHATENSQPGTDRSIPSFDYDQLQPMDGVLYTTLQLPPILASQARTAPSDAPVLSVPPQGLAPSLEPHHGRPASAAVVAGGELPARQPRPERLGVGRDLRVLSRPRGRGRPPSVCDFVCRRGEVRLGGRLELEMRRCLRS